MAKEKKSKQPARDLQKIITEGRERKKVQDTADKIFGNRTVGGLKGNTAGGPLSNRAGVNKRAGTFRARATGRDAIAPPIGRRVDARAKRNAQGIADALFSSQPNPAKAQANIVPNRKDNGDGVARPGATQFAGAAARAGAQQQAPPSRGLTIKGLAGPHMVEVAGFAPGTTAADVEEALRARDISVHSCRILQSSPKVIADILCESKEDADRIGEFHLEWTDYDARTGKGFQLFVFAPRPAPTAPTTTTSKPQPSRNNGVLVDGSMGFEPLPMDHGDGDSGLYSDQLVQPQPSNHQYNNQNTNRRGRGFRGGRVSNNR